MKTRLRFTVGTVAITTGAVGLWYTTVSTRPAAAPAVPAVSTATARIVRGDVTQRVSVAGTLGYDRAFTVYSQLPAGIVTAVARAGTTVGRGRQLFAVSGVPAVLMYGRTPAYRAFTAGMSDGRDVEQLESNLAALGHDPGRVDDDFTPATTAAIRRWQRARGLPAAARTGTLPLGHVAFLAGPIRISQTPMGIGTRMAPGARALSGSSTTRAVTARVTTEQRHLVRTGDRVRVSLPSGDPVEGRITRIGRIAQAPAQPTPGASSRPTVPITVALRVPRDSADLDETPVQVAITTASRRGVLMVPVTALLAACGGYQVRVVRPGGGLHLAAVEPGLFDDTAGTVEITGSGVTEGMNVEVPAS